MIFNLKPEQPYIELNKLLQIFKIAQTGGHSKILIQNEEVKLNGKVETQIRKKLVKGDVIDVEGKKITIS